MTNFKIVCLSLFIALSSCTGNEKKDEVKIADNFDAPIRIPMGENSWLEEGDKASHDIKERKIITEEGIRNWSNPKQKIATYLHVQDTGEFHVGLNLKGLSDETELKIAVGNQSKKIQLDDTTTSDLPIATFTIKEPGYQKITIASENEDEQPIANINELLVGGAATDEEVNFVEDNFHFGRRGPSVHLRYPIPSESKKPQYFYNEVHVPEGEDVIGSYFMANGFAHGYFGIQVNSEDERRILFSVWSPYDTQDPKEIPEDQRIELLGKGEDVHTGEFGNEGSGGQSYKKFMWQTDTTYKFLLKGEPSGDSFTDYTAYFYNPEEENWELIASFKRPEAGNYLGSLYSFLENFAPPTGDVARKGEYKNQWLYDKEEGWMPLDHAEFTADNTANRKDRMDYAGGETEGGYYLENCGFFDDYTEVNSKFTRDVQEEKPDIDFDDLP